MGTLTPFRDMLSAQDSVRLNFAIQDGQPPTQQAPTPQASTEQPAPQEPLFDGTDTAQWIGFGAFISIFLIIIIAIIRARVIKPAERMARETDFFEPAGANAEITFDPPAQSDIDGKSLREKDRKKKQNKKKDRKDLNRDPLTELFPANDPEVTPEEVEPLEEVVAETVLDSEPDPKMAEIAAAIDSAATDEKTATPFAGLFSRGDEEQRETPEYEGALDVLDLVEAKDDAAAPDDVRIDHLPEIDQDYWDAERERRETAEFEQAEEDRRRAREEAAQMRANADADLRRRADAVEAGRREAERAQRNADAQFDQRMQAMSAMQGKLDAMADRLARDADGVETRISTVLEEKFNVLSDDMHQRLHTAAVDIDARLQDAGKETRAPDSDAAAIATHVATLQQTMEAALMSLAERIDALSAAQAADQARPEELRRLNALLAERAAPAVAGTLQLGDLVRSALPSDRYAFDRELESGAKADCMISRPGAAAFAIDARFPADAFDRYARAEEKNRDHAATAYRRAILRHMIFVAEKLIVRNETADFAILFVPNDTIFTDLHRNFADIVQDSYRARIWIASPTSLMATLHMMNAASQTDGDTEPGEDIALKGAVAALTDRISALEGNLARVSATTPETARNEEQSSADLENVDGPSPDDASIIDVAASDEAAETADMQADEIAPTDADDAMDNDETTGDTDAAARPPFPLR